MDFNGSSYRLVARLYLLAQLSILGCLCLQSCKSESWTGAALSHTVNCLNLHSARFIVQEY